MELNNYFIYHKSSESLIVIGEEELNEYLATGDWFKTPHEAKEAFEKDLKALDEEKPKKTKAKDATDG